MNRLQLRQPSHDEKSVRPQRTPIDSTTLSRRPDTALTALFAPIHYEPNYAYPLLVWLHGEASNERQIRSVMPHISLRNYVGVSVRGARGADTGSVARIETEGRQDACHWRQTADGIELAGDLVTQAIALAEGKFHVHPDRIFLAGIGVGGTMALRLALRTPQRFAGVISLGGRVPDGHLPLASLNAARQRIRVLLAQSRSDGDYLTDRLCDDLRLLHAAGIDVMVRQYPDYDYLARARLADVDAWLMSQITAPPVDEVQVSRYDGTSQN